VSSKGRYAMDKHLHYGISSISGSTRSTSRSIMQTTGNLCKFLDIAVDRRLYSVVQSTTLLKQVKI
jgi:hypothetical protein